MNDNKLLELYTLTELSYQKHFEKVVDDVNVLYPAGWYENKNYIEKIEILSEAIKDSKLIVNTKSYQNTVEGVEKKVKGLVM